MQRAPIAPRDDWQQKVTEAGLIFHTPEGEGPGSPQPDRPYWDESACYQFTTFQIDTLELATQTLHEMCLDLVREVIEERMLGLFLVPPEFERYVIQSWERDEPSVYGRFDLAYDGVGPPKLPKSPKSGSIGVAAVPVRSPPSKPVLPSVWPIRLWPPEMKLPNTSAPVPAVLSATIVLRTVRWSPLAVMPPP